MPSEVQASAPRRQGDNASPTRRCHCQAQDRYEVRVAYHDLEPGSEAGCRDSASLHQ